MVALADVDAAAAAGAAKEFGVARVTTDYRELLEDPGIDVIDVVTGNQPHFQISWDALSAGKHVLCEKPVHIDYRQTQKAAELARWKELKTKLGFSSFHLARLRPGDQASVRARGQGFRPAGFPAEVTPVNLDPDLLTSLPVSFRPGAGQLAVQVRAVFGSALGGNGIGRPAAGWDLDLQLDGPPPDGTGPGVLLGDLVAVSDLDTRYNMGYRRGWVTVGVIAHGSSPLPGHGPGMTPILTGPASALVVRAERDRHAGLAAVLNLQLRSEVTRG